MDGEADWSDQEIGGVLALWTFEIKDPKRSSLINGDVFGHIFRLEAQRSVGSSGGGGSCLSLFSSFWRPLSASGHPWSAVITWLSVSKCPPFIEAPY